jgi:hypothetical protein
MLINIIEDRTDQVNVGDVAFQVLPMIARRSRRSEQNIQAILQDPP